MPSDHKRAETRNPHESYAREQSEQASEPGAGHGTHAARIADGDVAIDAPFTMRMLRHDGDLLDGEFPPIELVHGLFCLRHGIINPDYTLFRHATSLSMHVSCSSVMPGAQMRGQRPTLHGHLPTALSLKHFPFQFGTQTKDAKTPFSMKQLGNVRGDEVRFWKG